MNSYLIQMHDSGKIVVVRANSLNEAMLISQEDYIPMDGDEDFLEDEWEIN